MYKFMVFCTLFVCALSAPTEKPKESDLSFPVNPQVFSSVLTNSTSDEKREKREDSSVPSSSSDNKRASLPSQSDYPENKPPTFVHPVPVDQIIKNSNASPEIHSAKHDKDVIEEEDHNQKEIIAVHHTDDDSDEQDDSTNKRANKYRTNTDSDESVPV